MVAEISHMQWRVSTTMLWQSSFSWLYNEIIYCIILQKRLTGSDSWTFVFLPKTSTINTNRMAGATMIYQTLILLLNVGVIAQWNWSSMLVRLGSNFADFILADAQMMSYSKFLLSRIGGKNICQSYEPLLTTLQLYRSPWGRKSQKMPGNFQ